MFSSDLEVKKNICWNICLCLQYKYRETRLKANLWKSSIIFNKCKNKMDEPVQINEWNSFPEAEVQMIYQLPGDKDPVNIEFLFNILIYLDYTTSSIFPKYLIWIEFTDNSLCNQHTYTMLMITDYENGFLLCEKWCAPSKNFQVY